MFSLEWCRFAGSLTQIYIVLKISDLSIYMYIKVTIQKQRPAVKYTDVVLAIQMKQNKDIFLVEQINSF